MSQKHFYQKFSTWVAVSFLSGATVMVAAVSSLGLPKFQAPGFIATKAASLNKTAAVLPIAVSIVQPTEGQSFNFQSIIAVSAVAQGQQSVKSVAVWVDDQFITTCFTAVCTINLPASSLATQSIHTVQAITTSEFGLTASSLVHFFVSSGQ